MVDFATEGCATRRVACRGADPLHIVFLCNEYPPATHGGIGSFTQTMALALDARGHKVTVVGFYDQAEDRRENDRGVGVVRLAHTRLQGMGLLVNGLRLSRELERIHAVSPIDIIEGPENSLALVHGMPSAVKIIRMHGGHHFFFTTLGKDPRFWRSWLEKRSFRKADHLCGVSRFVAETTRNLLKLNGHPIEVLPNPVNVMQFRPYPEIDEERGLIVFVGTLCEKKGVRQLVQAMPQIVQAIPEAHLLLVGRDSNDPVTGASFADGLRTLIPAELEDHVAFHGVVGNASLPEMLARAEVLIYPSHMEAIGIALIEGLAMGKGLVIGNTGPAQEVVEHGISGLLCDPFSPASIADTVVTLLKDPNLRRSMGARARERAVELFSLEKVVERNEAFYRRCLGRNGHE
ncbi:MAG TPA: glycosyltransferase family 4 protein [Verrucomicrobiae bacterium]|nr:glycosyltransferase family 4 protein [Verrucomicrobiae bacterium]